MVSALSITENTKTPLTESHISQDADSDVDAHQMSIHVLLCAAILDSTIAEDTEVQSKLE